MIIWWGKCTWPKPRKGVLTKAAELGEKASQVLFTRYEFRNMWKKYLHRVRGHPV